MSVTFAQLGTVAEFINGAAFKPDDWDDSGAQIIRIQNLTDPTKPFNRTKRVVSERLRVQPDDLLVSWSATLGVFEWAGPEEALLNQHIFRVLPDEKKVDKRYLRHGLEGAILDMQRHLHGATMQHVNRGEFLSTKLFLPPLAEQRRIADVLDRAEALRAKRRAALAQFDILTQALFLDLFGDTATNPKGWKAKPLRELVSEFRYGTSSKSQARGKPALRIPNVIGGIIDVSDLKLVPVDTAEFERLKLIEGDVLFVRTNGNPDFVGRCAVFDLSVAARSGFPSDDFIFASYLIRARLGVDQITPIFLREFMLGTEGRRELRSRSKTSAGQFNINTEHLGAIAVPVPPLSLQHDFARRVAAVEKLKTAHRASLAGLDALFAALQNRAFRGEL
jgi:type I restriction enzyme S subunit